MKEWFNGIKGICKRIIGKIKIKKYDVDDAMARIEELRKQAKPGTDEWRHLAMDYEQELSNKKLAKELKFLGIPAWKILVTLLILVVYGFSTCLDMDSPKAVKLATRVIDIFRHEV